MRVIFLSLFIVLCDQITKLKVKGLFLPTFNIEVKGMRIGESIPVWGDFFKLTFIENNGMAFGLEIGGKLTLSIFTIIATGIIIYLIYKNRKESLYLRISLGFILGGAVGNLIDRVFYGKLYGYAPIFYGKVVDFFHFNIPDFNLFGKTVYSFPIFNIADIAVTAGFLMIIFGYKKIFKPTEENPPQDTDELSENLNDVSSQTDIINEKTGISQTGPGNNESPKSENSESPKTDNSKMQ